MSRTTPCRIRSRHGARGMTLIEATISIVIVAVMLVAALNTVGAARAGETSIAERRQALLLARDLLAEILRQDYEEPVDTVAFGRESSESGGDREDWDDVDDYFGWQASPPEDKDGDELSEFEGYGREVSGGWVNPTNLNQYSGSPTEIKGIEVLVTYNGREVVKLVGVRTSARPGDGTAQQGTQGAGS